MFVHTPLLHKEAHTIVRDHATIALVVPTVLVFYVSIVPLVVHDPSIAINFATNALYALILISNISNLHIAYMLCIHHFCTKTTSTRL